MKNIRAFIDGFYSMRFVLLIACAIATVGATCRPVPAPTPGPPRVTATPTATGQPEATRTPTIMPTPLPPPATLQQLTSGIAVFEIDLSSFAVAPPDANGDILDIYAFATLAWEKPKGTGADRYPKTPAVQLGLRGTKKEPCIAKPCQGKAALEVRYSANVTFDRSGVPEKSMCGEGTKPPLWLPIGPGPKHQVVLEWTPGFVRASTSVTSVELHQGAASPGFGWWTPGIPPKGLGWAYKEDWTIQAHGGTAQLLSFKATGEQPPLLACP